MCVHAGACIFAGLDSFKCLLFPSIPLSHHVYLIFKAQQTQSWDMCCFSCTNAPLLPSSLAPASCWVTGTLPHPLQMHKPCSPSYLTLPSIHHPLSHQLPLSSACPFTALPESPGPCYLYHAEETALALECLLKNFSSAAVSLWFSQWRAVFLELNVRVQV